VQLAPQHPDVAKTLLTPAYSVRDSFTISAQKQQHPAAQPCGVVASPTLRAMLVLPATPELTNDPTPVSYV
jgi:hypothetical protein